MPRILVIDDEPDIRNMIREVLRLRSFDVTSAPDGLAGVRMARQAVPDLILCDVRMPGLDGYSVLQQVRHDPATAAVPFILMTGQADLPGMRKGMIRGADDYLPKPFEIEELLRAVDTRLQKLEAMRAKAGKEFADLRMSISMMLPHELLTPLTGILGLADFLTENPDALTPGDVAELGRNIRRSGERLHRLVQNFLIFAQLELAQNSPQYVADLRSGSTPDIRDAIESVVKRTGEFHHRTDDWTCEIPRTSAGVAETYLAKIAEELLDNAFKFSSPGTPVRISADQCGDRVRLTVSDKGRGMKTEQSAAVGAYMQFERRLHEQQGSGLGLVITKRIADLHGGSVRIESQLDVGTTVTVDLPVHAADNGSDKRA